jgi:hypothetical protein
MVFAGSIGAKGITNRIFNLHFSRHKIIKKLKILGIAVWKCKKIAYPLIINLSQLTPTYISHRNLPGKTQDLPTRIEKGLKGK